MKISGKLSQISFIITREFRAISTSYAVLLVLMGGIFVYGLLYNYMYAPNIVTDAPVAVVDNSHSSLSRQYIRWLDATPQVAVYAQAMDYREAREWMKEGKVQGILYIPDGKQCSRYSPPQRPFSMSRRCRTPLHVYTVPSMMPTAWMVPYSFLRRGCLP